MKLDPEYQFFWWMGVVGVIMAWLAFTILLFFSAGDLPMLWDWHQAPWVGRIGYPVLAALTTFYLRLGGAGWKASLALSTGVAGLILFLGLECAILGLFGSPSWESVQAWAREHHPTQSWVQEPLLPRWSACGKYCMDVLTWQEIRCMLLGGH